MVERRTVIALAATVAIHALLALFAATAPEPVSEPAPEARKSPVRVRTFTPKPTPKPKPEPKPVPVPEPVEALPVLEPLEPLVTQAPPPAEPVVEPTPNPRQAEATPENKPKKKKRKRRKRGPGRTVTSKNGKGAPATSTPDGAGSPVDLGEWDPNAGPGSTAPLEPEEPAAPANVPAPRGDATGQGPGTATKKAEPARLVPPRPKSRPAGRYPPGVARSAGPVDVVLTLNVSTEGTVTRVKVVRSQGPELDEEAKRIVRRVRFDPATRGGRKVAMTIPWTVTFR